MDVYKTLTLAVSDGIATNTLSRPERRNAVNAKLAGELRHAVTTCDGDPDVDVMILTGSGNTFRAGMDLAALGSVPVGAGWSMLGVQSRPRPP